MNKNCTVLVFVTALLGGVATAQAQSEFAANLSGSEEVPPVASTAFGQATFDLNFSESTLGLNYTLSATNLKQAFMAHIHCAPDGMNGPIVLDLAGAAPGNRAYNLNGPWIGSAEVTDSTLRGTMCTDAAGNPVVVNTLLQLITLMRQGLTYVNIHTTANPLGEIRGQIQQVASFTVP